MSSIFILHMIVPTLPILICREAWEEAGFHYDIGDYEGGSVVRATIPAEDDSQIFDVVSS